MKNLSQHITESFQKVNEAKEPIVAKDWDRMLTLIMKGDDGEQLANSIKDKTKAIARFVAGVKLWKKEVLDHDDRRFRGPFDDLGNKALELGATFEEIQAIFDSTPEPTAYFDKMQKLDGKKLKDRFVGDITRAVLGLGLDIEYLKTNGNAITSRGRDAMSRNGRKWTIGYKSVIDVNGQKYNLVFDAITDEGDGPTSYYLDRESDAIFNKLQGDVMGKLNFIKGIKEILTAQKQ